MTMHLTPTNLFAVICIAVIGLAATPTASVQDPAKQDPKPESTFGMALGLELGSLSTVEVGDAHAAKVATACAAELATVGRCGVWSGERKAGGRVFVGRAPIVGAEPQLFGLIALSPEMEFVAAAVTDDQGKVIEEWQHFMGGLKWHDVPRLAGAKPIRHLAEQRQRDDDDADLRRALLDLQRHMHEQAATFNLPKSSTRNREKEIEAMHRAFASVADLTKPLRPLLGDSDAEFERIANAAADTAGKMTKAMQERDREAAFKLRRQLMGSCKSCHQLQVGEVELKDVTNRARHRLGVGDGFYVIGHDLRIRHPDRERAQRVANALRMAALCVDATL